MVRGYLLINKPQGPTSHDIIDELRRLTGERRIGHAGTLDPFASGVLLVGVGREATRNLGKFVGLDKKYRAVLRLGYVSDTFDRTGLIQIQNSKFKIQNVIKNLKLKTI
ncbi:MAG: pseudouridine synthase, partial [Patescibacteria group bacterium]